MPELILLILAAFFHDIGMAPDVKTVAAWKKHWDSAPEFEDDVELNEFHNFRRFVASRPDQSEQIDSLSKQGKTSSAELAKSYLIADYIRATHASRAREIVETDWLDRIEYRDTNLAVEFATICFSHNGDALSLLELDKDYLCGPDIVACLPLVGVILRLADLLDFDGKRTPAVLFSHLFVRHPVSIREWSKHRAVESWAISPNGIHFHAKCNHPAIEAAVHGFCDIIDGELAACNNVLTVLNEFNRNRGREIEIRIPFRVDRSKIETKKDIYGKPTYLYRQSQFNLSKRQVIDLLMGTKLYGDPAVALRELLQNSIDACLLRKALEKKWGNPYDPSITVSYYQRDGEDILEVSDNGTGMDQHIIDAYYSKVGSSFYKSPDFYELKAESGADFMPTSRFGIGILSTFMVADTLEVDTRRIYGPHDSSDPLRLIIEGQESIFWISNGERKIPGTTTRLILRKSKNPWERMSESEFIESVGKVVPNPPFKINIKTTSSESVIDEGSFSQLTVDVLKNYEWDAHENITQFDIEFADVAQGFVGGATVAVLERSGVPVESIEVNSKTVDIDGEAYALEKTIALSQGTIELTSTSIEIDDDADISTSTSTQRLTPSRSRISLHGIEVSASLFPEAWNRQRNQVRLDWPLPMLLVIDICGKRDLDLNSARTQIIMSDQWASFEVELAFAVFSHIARNVTEEYWTSLLALLAKSKNQLLSAGLKRVCEAIEEKCSNVV